MGRSLFRKYVVVLVALVSGGLLASGLTQMYVSYQETQAALTSIQREKAAAAAARIEAFLEDVERQVAGALPPPPLTGPVLTPEQRRNDLLRLLRQAPAVTDVSYLDHQGREQLQVSRVSLNVVNSQLDRSAEAAFVGALERGTYFGPVHFRDGSEPYLTLAIAERGARGGVIVTEVNLKLIWDIVSHIQVGQAGLAYVVDERGQLVAHPDISRVLQRADFSALPQVQAALAQPTPSGEDATIAMDFQSRRVLTARQTIDRVGWSVFTEQPLEEAFSPLYAAVLRSALLLLLGVLLAVGASLLLARRMVRPIQALQAGATRIGGGALEQQIEVHTDDELEALAAEFNHMADRLRESYATLELQVADRTRELGTANEQLQIASRHKSEFLASMSHELRTPLNAVIGLSEVLTLKVFGDLNAKQEEYLQDILAAGRHLLALINDILDLSKVEAGKMDLERDAFSLAETLDTSLIMVRERAMRHGINLSLDVDPAIGLVEADERKIKQVLFNLLSNAVKFTPDHGRVDVSATQIGDEVRVEVRDTGIGIAIADQDRIFEAFHQAGGGRTTSREGTGLGLTLARTFVELHGGRLWVDSQPGVGSTFTFSLPWQSRATAEPGALVAAGA